MVSKLFMSKTTPFFDTQRPLVRLNFTDLLLKGASWVLDLVALLYEVKLKSLHLFRLIRLVNELVYGSHRAVMTKDLAKTVHMMAKLVVILNHCQ